MRSIDWYQNAKQWNIFLKTFKHGALGKIFQTVGPIQSGIYWKMSNSNNLQKIEIICKIV